MKALVKKEAAPGLWMEDVPVPAMGDEDVLIKIHKTSICGTDVHIYKMDDWDKIQYPVPMVIGHEFMGEIAKVGTSVKNLKMGQRVCGEGHIVCNRCPNCRMGKKHLCMDVMGTGYDCPGCFGEFFSPPSRKCLYTP